MKTKVIFMIISMNIGGTEKSLLSLIDNIDKYKYDVTILMLEKKGGFLEDVPSWVKIEVVEGYGVIKPYINEPPKELIKKLYYNKEILEMIRLLCASLKWKLTNNKEHYFDYINRKINPMKENYDIAVAYAGPMDFITYHVYKNIKAKTKIQWIHFDVTRVGFDIKMSKKLYGCFSKIFVVSEEGRQKLIKMIPEISDKVEVKHNVISKEKILKMAEKGETYTDDFTGKRILTVGRLSKEKGQDIAIETMKKLKDEGIDVKWYCIGDGSARKEYEDMIRKYRLENDFILLGSKSNPYRYMKDCDLYVQPSRHEGYCITLAEVKCFNKPIVCTNFVGANEQLKDYKSKIAICDKENDLYDSIKLIMG